MVERLRRSDLNPHIWQCGANSGIHGPASRAHGLKVQNLLFVEGVKWRRRSGALGHRRPDRRAGSASHG